MSSFIWLKVFSKKKSKLYRWIDYIFSRDYPQFRKKNCSRRSISVFYFRFLSHFDRRVQSESVGVMKTYDARCCKKKRNNCNVENDQDHRVNVILWFCFQTHLIWIKRWNNNTITRFYRIIFYLRLLWRLFITIFV